MLQQASAKILPNTMDEILLQLVDDRDVLGLRKP